MKEEYFIFAGRIDKQKGIDILLEAWKLMDKDAPKLLICGTGPMEDWCKNYIKENKLNAVEMKGFVPNTEAKKLIANSKALILPTQWYEGFPMTIVEAYSVGTPVIGSNMGNVGSLIEEGVSGEVFDSMNPTSIAEVVKKVMKCDKYNVPMVARRYGEKENYMILMDVYAAVSSQ